MMNLNHSQDTSENSSLGLFGGLTASNIQSTDTCHNYESVLEVPFVDSPALSSHESRLGGPSSNKSPGELIEENTTLDNLFI